MVLPNLDATRCKAARAALGLGVRELAAMADVSPDTVLRLEEGRLCVSAPASRYARR